MSGAAPLDIISNGRVLSVMRSISMRKKGKKEEAGEKVEHTC